MGKGRGGTRRGVFELYKRGEREENSFFGAEERGGRSLPVLACTFNPSEKNIVSLSHQPSPSLPPPYSSNFYFFSTTYVLQLTTQLC
jgi:hypothetical protein